jgi:hypothetical protein
VRLGRTHFFYQLLAVKPLTFLLLSLVTELTPVPLLRQQWLSLQIRVKLSSMLLNFRGAALQDIMNP